MLFRRHFHLASRRLSPIHTATLWYWASSLARKLPGGSPVSASHLLIGALGLKRTPQHLVLSCGL